MADNAVSQKECANAIRALSMDAVQKAKSGTQVLPWAWRILLKYSGANT